MTAPVGAPVAASAGALTPPGAVEPAPPTLSQIRAFDPTELDAAADAARDASRRVFDVVDAVRAAAARGLDGWTGSAADAAAAALHSTVGRAQAVGFCEDRVAADLRASAGRLGTARDAVLAAADEAIARGMTIDESAPGGPAVLPAPVRAGTAEAAYAARDTERAADRLRDALAGFARVDGDAAAALEAGAAAVADAASDSGPRGLIGELSRWLTRQDLPPLPPDATPQDNRAYWASLTDAQRTEMIRLHPATTGAMDGVPSDARHRANMTLLDSERARLEHARDELSRGTLQTISRHLPLMPGPSDGRIDRIDAKLADIEAVRTVMARHPGARLMALDMRSGERGRAAVAVGDPDTAENVSVTTPGDNTTVAGSLGGMVDEAAALREEAEAQIAATRPDADGSGSVAAIAWIGYDTPQVPTSVGGWLSAFAEDPVGLSNDLDDTLTPDAAVHGAVGLSRFLDGADVASHAADPHVTALGHSYGSVTTALALRDPSLDGSVDDAVFYGSPGLYATGAADLDLPDHHAYLLEADGDVIADVGFTGVFGPDPSGCDGFDQLSTDRSITPDGVHRDEATGHSQYARPDSDGDLRTSGYNIAAVVAGIPENLLYK